MAYEKLGVYGAGFSLPELLSKNVSGIVTSRDQFVTDIDLEPLRERVADFHSKYLSTADFQRQYGLQENYQWKVDEQRLLTGAVDEKLFTHLTYRPFDNRYIYYSDNLVFRARRRVMRHLVGGHPNWGLGFNRSVEGGRRFGDAFVFASMIQHHSLSLKEVNYLAPLYLYPDDATDQTDAFTPIHRTPNFDPKLYAAICKAAGIDPADQAGSEDDFRTAMGEDRPSEVKVFDYIYGVLHSPAYRETFAEFLKIDFPRIPYPTSPQVFRHVSEKGEQLRRLHLMEFDAIGDTPYPYDGEGDDVVASGYPKFEDGKVRINKDQHFDAVPGIAWIFHIGGYQPAQKWLKDRRGRSLSWDDIGHYQKIVKILVETDRIMKEIELPL